MKKEQIVITFKRKSYKIRRRNIEYIVSRLENIRNGRKQKYFSDEELLSLMKEYKLMDVGFLEDMEGYNNMNFEKMKL